MFSPLMMWVEAVHALNLRPACCLLAARLAMHHNSICCNITKLGQVAVLVYMTDESKLCGAMPLQHHARA